MILAPLLAIMTGFRAAKVGKSSLLWGIIGFVMLIMVQNCLVFLFLAVFGAGSLEIVRLAAGLVGIVVTFLILKQALPIVKYLAKPPDGTEIEYEFERLREDFLGGKVTSEWVARRKDESDYRSVVEVLYPQK